MSVLSRMRTVAQRFSNVGVQNNPLKGFLKLKTAGPYLQSLIVWSAERPRISISNKVGGAVDAAHQFLLREPLANLLLSVTDLNFH